MRRYVEQLVLGTIAGVLSYYTLPLIPEVPTRVEFLQYANEPPVQFIIFLLLVWYALSLIVGEVRRRRRKKRGGAFTISSTLPREIRRPKWQGTLRRFGVDWEGKYGRARVGQEPVGLAKGPYCPNCGTNLMTGKNQRYLRKDKPIWKCPNCTFKKARPKDFKYEEKEAVGHMIKREVEVDENRLDDKRPRNPN